MGLTIKVTSSKIGSNQGGRSIIEFSPHHQIPVYTKHCMGSNIPRGRSFFNPTNQPIYEAITFQIATHLGLSVPNFYVLQNQKNDIQFYSVDGVKSDIRSGRPFYFSSELMIPPEHENVSEAERIIDREKVYLELLQISDIIGTKQNYLFRDGAVFYLDLGCSFVDAHGGFLELHRKHRDPLTKKDLKKALKNLERYTLIGRDNHSSMSLADLVEMPRFISLPVLNPKGSMTLENLGITEYEIEEIVGRLASGIVDSHILRDYGDSPYLYKNNGHH